MDLKQSEMKDVEENKGTYLPRILDMRVYYGLSDKDGDKKPDPKKILFYGAPDGSCYDCESQEWLIKKPAVCDHLPNREIEASDDDLIAAIAHGIMDDNDYDALDKNGMITEMPKKLWENIKKLKALHAQLEQERSEENLKKAEDEQKDASFDEESEEESLFDEDELLEPEEEVFSFDDNIESQEEQYEEKMPGDDVVSKIVSQAMAEADDRIRQIVREEISKLLSEDEDEYNSPEMELDE
jgi:hypothetical protein